MHKTPIVFLGLPRWSNVANRSRVGATRNAAIGGNSHALRYASELADGLGGECEPILMRCAQ